MSSGKWFGLFGGLIALGMALACGPSSQTPQEEKLPAVLSDQTKSAPPAEPTPQVPAVAETTFKPETSYGHLPPLPTATPTPIPFLAETTFRRFGAGPVVQGYLTWPDGQPVRGGVLLIHDWWGSTVPFKQEANRLAQEGYVSLAVDLYQGKLPAGRSEAARMMRDLNGEEVQATLKAGLDWIASEAPGETTRFKMGAMGFDWGGELAFNLSTRDDRLAALIVFSGQPLLTDQQLNTIPCPVLGIYPSRDQLMTPDRVEALKQKLMAVQPASHVVAYSALPGFYLRPQSAVDRTWVDKARQEIDRFLTQQLAKPTP